MKIIAKQYNCDYSAALFQILKEHPDAPSFLSLQYILQQMGKESFAMHATYEELQNLPRPFIAHICYKGNAYCPTYYRFSLITQYNEHQTS